MVCLDSDFGGKASSKVDGDTIGGGGCLLGVCGEFPHVGWGCGVGVFEDPGFVRNVEEVLVGGPGLGSGLLDGDRFFSSKCDEGLASCKAVVEF